MGARAKQSRPQSAQREQVMSSYSKELKQSVITKMLPPNNRSVPELAKETGIPLATLYTWRTKCRKTTHNSRPKSEGARSLSLNSEDKFSILVETAAMNEFEIGEYCRNKGLYPEQIHEWKTLFMQSNGTNNNTVDKKNIRQKDQQIKQLESQLRRKEKALAEAAALLILQKKVQGIWELPEDGKSPFASDDK